MKIISGGSRLNEATLKNLEEQLNNFNDLFEPLEKGEEYLLVDKGPKAIYFECHVQARKLIELSTIDVPLDPDFQAEYRANRDIVEDHNAYLAMKQDALANRSFSNIIDDITLNSTRNSLLRLLAANIDKMQ